MYYIHLAIIGLLCVQPVSLDHCGTYETFTNKVLDIEQTNKDGKTELLTTRNASTEIECRDICCETDTCSVASFDSSKSSVGGCQLYSCTPLENCAFKKQKHIDSYVIKRSADNTTGNVPVTSEKTSSSSFTTSTASASPSSTSAKDTSSTTFTTKSTTTGSTTTTATTHGTTTTTTKQTTKSAVQAPTTSQQSKSAQEVSSSPNSNAVQNNVSSPDQLSKSESLVNETITTLSSSSETQLTPLATTKTPVNMTSVESAVNATSTKTPVNITSAVPASTIGQTVAKTTITTQGAKNIASTGSIGKTTTATSSQLSSTAANNSTSESNVDDFNSTTTELAMETTTFETTVTTQEASTVSNVTVVANENVLTKAAIVTTASTQLNTSGVLTEINPHLNETDITATPHKESVSQAQTGNHTGNISAEILNFNIGNGQVQTPAVATALIAALSFGIIFFVAVLAVIAKYCFDNWQRRHYSRIDYLINGMYN